MSKLSIKQMAFASTLGAAYAVLTIVLEPISYGPIQLRLSEAFCVLPFFFPYTTWGLFIGCGIANLLSAYGIIDVVFGSLATLLAGGCTMLLGRINREKLSFKILACAPPVLFNGIIIGGVLAYSMTPEAFWGGLLTFGLQVALGEMVVLYALGLPLLCYLPRLHFFRKLQSN